MNNKSRYELVPYNFDVKSGGHKKKYKEWVSQKKICKGGVSQKKSC